MTRKKKNSPRTKTLLRTASDMRKAGAMVSYRIQRLILDAHRGAPRSLPWILRITWHLRSHSLMNKIDAGS
jgi:hypothetical protein